MDRLAVTVSIPVTAAPTGTANQSFCEIEAAKVSSLIATGTDIRWYTVPTGGTALASTDALANGTYYASQTLNGCESLNRLSVTVVITVTAAPTGTASQDFCEIAAAKVSDLTATGTDIKWYTVPTGGTALASTDALSNGTYYASQTLNGCESLDRLAVTVSITVTAAPTGTASQSFCEIAAAKVSNLIATGTDIKWYTVPTGGTALASTDALTN